MNVASDGSQAEDWSSSDTPALSVDGRFDYVPIIKKPVQRQALQTIFVPPEGGGQAAFPRRRYGGRVGRAATAGQS